MARHQHNQNLVLHYGTSYQGLSIQDKGPFIKSYLSRLLDTIYRATEQYREVFAFRIDLRLPTRLVHDDYLNQNEVIERFFASLKAKIRHNRKQALRENKKAHESEVRYVWAREAGHHERPHYHLAILLNKDAFRVLGKFEPARDNMFNRLNEAWASALNLSLKEVSGLVEIPLNACYFIHRNDQTSIEDFFYRASYLCKAATKTYGNGAHGFGASRI